MAATSTRRDAVPEPAAGDDAVRRSSPDATANATASATDASFAEFWRTARDRVAAALAVTLGDADLAAEATDEAMARAYQRWARLARYENPGGWVYRVGLNWARSTLRRRRRVHPRPGRDVVDDPAVAEPAVGEALAELDVKHRSVVVCRFLLDWSVDQTAEALDIRPGTVKSRLSRALDQLRVRLDHLHGEETQ